MRQVNASSSNFAAKLESSTPMARLAPHTSGLCLFVLFLADSIQHSSITVDFIAMYTPGFSDMIRPVMIRH